MDNNVIYFFFENNNAATHWARALADLIKTKFNVFSIVLIDSINETHSIEQDTNKTKTIIIINIIKFIRKLNEINKKKKKYRII